MTCQSGAWLRHYVCLYDENKSRKVKYESNGADNTDYNITHPDADEKAPCKQGLLDELT